MGAFISRYATPLTTGLFAVSAISGVALFVHWLPAAFHGMHEWLSLLLLVPFGLHVWKNWRPLVGYAKRGSLVVGLLASLVVAVPFAWSGLSGGAGGGNPAFRVVALMTRATVDDLAPVLKTTPDALVGLLKGKGYAAATGQTIEAIASAAGVPANEVLFALAPAR